MKAHTSQEHWTDLQLLNRLYAPVSADQGYDQPDSDAGHQRHLASCAKCAVRWREMQIRRTLVVSDAATDARVSDQFLVAQRARIYARLDDQPSSRRVWIPAAVAAMCVLAVGLLLNRTAAPPPTDVADAQLFADVYSMEQSDEPQAAVPIHALFEEGQ